MNVPYIVIDPSFPHHINSFDNVPVNYLNGPLVNISVFSTSTTTYFNDINYTLQAANSPYNTFLEPYSRNKVLLFLTSLYFRGTNEQANPVSRPINFTVLTSVVDENQYRISVSLSI
jgi:hypothetical protein